MFQPYFKRGCCVFAAAALIFTLAVRPVSAALESWENPNDPTFDGWTIPTSENAGFTAAYSTVAGVTNGLYSLAISPTAANMPPAQQTDPPFLARAQPMAKCFAARFRNEHHGAGTRESSAVRYQRAEP